MGGVGPEKKSSRKNLKFFFGPNRVIIPLVHDFKKVIFLKSKKNIFEKKKKCPTGRCSSGGLLQGGCRANPFWEKGPNRGINPIGVEVLRKKSKK